MAFEIKNKVALVTGGVSGLGYQYALELLENGAKGVTLADVNSEGATQSIKYIESKYGKNRAIFVKTDVTVYEQFEDAFKKTLETFKNIDILINNAGAMNDAEWQKTNAINLNGTINGILLGLETYLPKYKSGSEGIIVNISSVVAIGSFAPMPIYTGTKLAIYGMTLSWGLPVHYDRTNVRVVGVCVGGTKTKLLINSEDRVLEPAYKDLYDNLEFIRSHPLQTTEQAAPWIMLVIEKAPSGTIWVVEGGEPPYQYESPNRLTIPKVHL